MKRVLWAIVLHVLMYQLSMAGADTLRYRDVVFSQVKMDSVIYTTQGGQALYMDVYQPAGDTARHRPLIILAHGGSFMHGNRKCDCLPAMCRALAQRGYVVASIEYRLTNLLGLATKHNAYNTIIKAVSDGRHSVRWFLNDAADGNTFGINPARIFFGGSSAGAILAEHLAYLDGVAKCSPALGNAAQTCLVDTDALPPNAIRGCISLAGAVLDTNLICTGGPALLHIQGDADHVVPFYYKHPISGLAPFRMAGLGACRGRYQSQHLDFTEYVFVKGGHTPWDTDPTALKIVVEQMAAFMSRELK